MNEKDQLPKNAQAIRDWVMANRKDLAPTIDTLLKNDGFILMTTIGFEAGRKFQSENPDKNISDRDYLS